MPVPNPRPDETQEEFQSRIKSDPSPDRFETKNFALEFKLDAEKREIDGHAGITKTEDLGGDTIESGAFKRTIKERFTKNLVKFRFMHRDPIGKVLRLAEDSTGLAFAAKISRTVLGDDVLTLIQDEAVDAMSIGFRPKVVELDEDDLDRFGFAKRRIKDLDLFEISVVDLGMHPDARIEGVKALEQAFMAELNRRLDLFEKRLGLPAPAPPEVDVKVKAPDSRLINLAQTAVGGLGEIAQLLRS